MNVVKNRKAVLILVGNNREGYPSPSIWKTPR